MDQAELENQVFPRHQQECRIEQDLGSDALLFAAELHYTQTKYCGTLQVLTRMIASVLVDQRLIIDMLSFDDRSIKKAREPVTQLALF